MVIPLRRQIPNETLPYFSGGNTVQSCYFLRILVWGQYIVKERWRYLIIAFLNIVLPPKFLLPNPLGHMPLILLAICP